MRYPVVGDSGSGSWDLLVVGILAAAAAAVLAGQVLKRVRREQGPLSDWDGQIVDRMDQTSLLEKASVRIYLRLQVLLCRTPVVG